MAFVVECGVLAQRYVVRAQSCGIKKFCLFRGKVVEGVRNRRRLPSGQMTA